MLYQKPEPIESGHHEVQGHDVRMKFLHHLERLFAIPGNTNDFDKRTAGQDLPDRLPHVSRIVHNQDPYETFHDSAIPLNRSY